MTKSVQEILNDSAGTQFRSAQELINAVWASGAYDKIRRIFEGQSVAGELAGMVAGDVLMLGAGTYTENVTLAAVIGLVAVGSVTIDGDVTLPAGYTEANINGSITVAGGNTITLGNMTITVPTGGLDLRTAVRFILGRVSPDEILKVRVGPEYTQQFSGFGGEEQEYLCYLGAGNEGVVTDVWAVISSSGLVDVTSKNYELRVYSDCGDVADLTSPDESKLTARFPLRFWLGGTYDSVEPVGDRIHECDGIECGHLDTPAGLQVYVRLKLPIPFSDGVLVQLWTEDNTGARFVPCQSEVGAPNPNTMYTWARYQLGSLSALPCPHWRLRAGVPGINRVDTGWAQAGGATWTAIDADTTVTQDAVVFHEGAESTSIAVAPGSLAGAYAYLRLPQPIFVRDYATLKFWLRANASVTSGDGLYMWCSSAPDGSLNTFEIPDTSTPIVLDADTWTEIELDLADYASFTTLWRSLVLAGTKAGVTFHIDDIRFVRADGHVSYARNQQYTDSSDLLTWLSEPTASGMLVGVAMTAQDPQAVPTFSALEENWSLKLNGSETYNWETSGFEDMFGPLAFYFDAGRLIGREWGCTYKGAMAIEAYRWMLDNPVMWLSGATGELPVPTFAGSRVNLEVIAVYYA